MAKLLYDAPDPGRTFEPSHPSTETRIRLWDDGVIQIGPCGRMCVEFSPATVADFDHMVIHGHASKRFQDGLRAAEPWRP